MKYFLIAGEASGDLHASNLMKQLKKQDPKAEFRFMGGDLMQEVADGFLMHYRETSYMLIDIFLHLFEQFECMRLPAPLVVLVATIAIIVIVAIYE